MGKTKSKRKVVRPPSPPSSKNLEDFSATVSENISAVDYSTDFKITKSYEISTTSRFEGKLKLEKTKKSLAAAVAQLSPADNQQSQPPLPRPKTQTILQTEGFSKAEKANRKKEKKERQRQKRQHLRGRQQLEIRDFAMHFQEEERRFTETRQREVKIGLLRNPRQTLQFCFKEIPCQLRDFKDRLTEVIVCYHTGGDGETDLLRFLLSAFFISVLLVALYIWAIADVQRRQVVAWGIYWVILGVLSSVGLGTGLHTFLLYLGPFIAKVAVAAQECSNLNFPRPPYPNEILCPMQDKGFDGQSETPSVLSIMGKVRWESLAWGFGTALGELPPYFVARAARISSVEDCRPDESSESPSQLDRRQQMSTSKRGCCLIKGVKNCVRAFILKAGFFGILLCAAIPNPLFDLAGITCGHFLVPFTTFFGATVLGKMLIKSQIQTFFVILASNDQSLIKVKLFFEKIPLVGNYLRNGLTELVDFEKSSLRDKTIKSGGTLKILLDVVFFLMIFYFLSSIINGFAQSYQKRLFDKSRKSSSKDRKRSTIRT